MFLELYPEFVFDCLNLEAPCLLERTSSVVQVAACDTENHVLLFKHSMADEHKQVVGEEPSSYRSQEVKSSFCILR